jgi:hypothetical protein
MIVTTAGRTNEEMIQTARMVALDLDCHYIDRQKKSIKAIQEIHQQDVLVIGKERFEWFIAGIEEPFFFHPNTASFRAKRLLGGESEPFLEATQLSKGMNFLDCTLGLASDSIIASLAAGEKGKIIGVEGNKFLAYLVKTGLKTWESSISELEEAMKRIEVIQGNHQRILPSFSDNSMDIVYFDPMFDTHIEESNGINAIRSFALYDDLLEDAIYHAKRIAKKRVVLKDHWESSRFEKFGFHVIKRKTAKFHYGYLEV